MNFTISEEVICKHPGRDLGLVKDNIYTIYFISKDSQGEFALELMELDAPEPFKGFLAWRFEKIIPSQKEKIKVTQTIEF